jgi:hypothetical protein
MDRSSQNHLAVSNLAVKRNKEQGVVIGLDVIAQDNVSGDQYEFELLSNHFPDSEPPIPSALRGNAFPYAIVIHTSGTPPSFNLDHTIQFLQPTPFVQHKISTS